MRQWRIGVGLLVSVLIAPLLAHASISAPVQVKNVSAATANGSNQSTLTPTSTTTIHNGLILCLFWKTNVTVLTVTGQGATWTDSGVGRTARPTDGYVQCFGAQDIPGSAGAVTVQFSGAPTASAIYMYLAEYPGVKRTGGMWGTQTASGTATSGTSVTASSITPIATDGMLIAMAISDDTNGTAGTNFTARVNPAGDAAVFEDRIFTSALSASTPSATFSSSVTKAVIFVAVVVAEPTAGVGITTTQTQAKVRVAANNTLPIVMGTNPTMGKRIVLYGSMWDCVGGSLGSGDMTDNKGNAYVLLRASRYGCEVAFVYLSDAISVTGSSFTITFHPATATDASQTFIVMGAKELSGLAITNPLDQSAIQSLPAGVTPITVGPTSTLAQANEYAIAVGAFSGGTVSWTTEGGWSEDLIETAAGTYNGTSAMFKTVAATTAVSHTWTGITSGQGAEVLVTLKGVSTVGGTDVGSLSRLKIASDNPRYIAKADDSPFFPLIDTAWFFPKLGTADRATYYADRVAKGFNTISIEALYWYFENTPASPGAPFISNNPAVVNTAFWSKLDTIITEADAAGLYVVLTPMWGYNIPGLFGIDATAIGNFGSFLGSRYAVRTNIIWNVLGEYQSLCGYDNLTTQCRTTIDAFAQGIRNGGAVQLMGIHPTTTSTATTSGNSGPDWHASAWNNIDMLQSGDNSCSSTLTYPENWQMNATNNLRSPIKPTIDMETAYENSTTCAGGLTRDAAFGRRKAYWSAFSGAMGHTYGETHIEVFSDPAETGYPWGFATGDYRQFLNTQGANQARYLKTLMETQNYHAGAPAQGMIVSTNPGGIHHVQAFAGPAFGFVYVPTGQPVTINMNVVNAGSVVNASWFDPKTGTSALLGQFPVGATTRVFTPTGTPGQSGNDSVLVLTSSTGGGGDTLPTGCTLTWANNTDSDLAGYYVYVDLSTVTLGPANRRNVGLVNTRTCNQLGIIADGNYHAAVSAYDTSGNESAKTSEVTFTISGSSGTALAPPAITPIADGGNSNAVVFTWANVVGAVRYGFYLHQDGTPYDPCSQLRACTTVDDALPHTVTYVLNPTQLYDWWMTSIDVNGIESTASGDSFTTGAAGVSSPTTVKITWSWSGLDQSKLKERLGQFDIYRASSLNGSYALIGSVLPSQPRAFTDTAASVPVACYKVVPVDQDGNSGAALKGTCVYGVGITADQDITNPEPATGISAVSQ